MIRWRLRVLMAEKMISNKELSELSGVHATNISKMKNSDTIEQISGKVLNNLCNGLTRAYRARGDNRIITPIDLLEYTYDDVLYVPDEEKSQRSRERAKKRVANNTQTKSSDSAA